MIGFRFADLAFKVYGAKLYVCARDEFLKAEGFDNIVVGTGVGSTGSDDVARWISSDGGCAAEESFASEEVFDACCFVFSVSGSEFSSSNPTAFLID